MFKLRLSNTIKGCFTSVGGCREDSASSPPCSHGPQRNYQFDLREESDFGRVAYPRSPRTPERREEPQGSFRSPKVGTTNGEEPEWRPSSGRVRSSSITKNASVDQLVDVLRSGTQDDQADAAEILFNTVTENAEKRAEVSMAGAIAPLVMMLSTGCAKGKLYAAYMLSSLTSVDGCRKDMEDAGAIGALLSLVIAPDTPVDGKKGAVRALGRLARNDSAAVSIVAAGGLPALITLLDSSDPSLLKRALITLYFVGADKEDLQVEIVRCGAVPRLVALCESTHSSVQAEAADVCKVLARSAWCAKAMASENAIETLVKVAENGALGRAKENALKALQRMSDKSPELRDKILSTGTGGLKGTDISDGEIQQLVGIINTGDQQLREQAAQVIEKVAAADPRASRDLAEPEVVSSLIDLLTTGSEEGRAYASWAIARLAEDTAVRDKLYYKGAVLPLIRVLRDCSGRGQEGAARALEKLASHKDAATTIIKEGELSAFLSCLDSGNEQTQLHGVRTLFLLRGVDSVVNSEILATDGVSILIRRCWRGSSEVQALALAVLLDLAGSYSHQPKLVAAGVVPMLLKMEMSTIPDVAQMGKEALRRLNRDDLMLTIEAERDLQARVTAMLVDVGRREGFSPSRQVEEAFRLIPRGAFVEPDKVKEAYMGTAVLLSDAGMELPPLGIHMRMLELLELHPCQSFLDVHSGTGFLTCLGAYLVGESGRAVGLMEQEDSGVCTFAEARVEQLSSLRGTSKLKPKFRKGNILALTKAGERFDRISIEASCQKKYLSELLSLLRPGGRLVVPCDGQLLVLREVHKAFHND